MWRFQFEDLQEAYLQRRRKVAQVQRQKQKVNEKVTYKDVEVASGGSDRYCSGLDDFQSVLTAFTRYRYVALCFFKWVVGLLAYEKLLKFVACSVV